MYKSPIDIYIEDASTSFIRGLNKQIDDKTIEAVMRYGITVDKDRLIKALEFDREQYDKGYQDGKHEVLNNLQIYIQKFLSDYSTIDFNEVTE